MRSIRSLALLLLGLAAAAPAAAQDRPDKDPDQRPDKLREILVPEGGFDKVLKRHPEGVFLTPEEWQRLFEGARRNRPPKPAREPSVPRGLIVERCDVQGSLHDQEKTFALMAEARVRCLGKGWRELALPGAGARLGAVLVDGRPGRVIERKGRSYLMLEAPSAPTITLMYSARIERLPDGPGGALTLPMLPATSGVLRFSLPPQMTLECQPETYRVQAGDKSSEVTVSLGAAASVRLSYRPKVARIAKEPYVVAEKLTVYQVGSNAVRLHGQARFRIYRRKVDRFELEVPAGFIVRSLDGAGSPTWIQRGRSCSIELAEARGDEAVFRFEAERANELGAITLGPVRAPTARRELGWVAFTRDADVKVHVRAERGLSRRDSLDSGLVSKGALQGLDRIYREGEGAFALELLTRPVTPKVKLSLTKLYELKADAISGRLIFDYRVTEGAIFTLKARVPAAYEVESIGVLDANGRPIADADHRSVERGEDHEIEVELKKGVRAGSSARVVVDLTRALPAGLKSLGSIAFPRISGSPADSIDGYAGIAITPEFDLRAEELVGLKAVPKEELYRFGLDHTDLVLAYRVTGREHGGTLRLRHRETELSAKTLVSHTVSDRVVTTRALLSFEVKGAPAREVTLLMPLGMANAAQVSGARIKEKSVAPAREPGLERWRLRFSDQQGKAFKLLVNFDTVLPAADQLSPMDFAAPTIHVDGVARESGVVAVFSSDSTEITAEPRELRPIEVTAVPRDPWMERPGRPLIAYSYVRPEYRLDLKVRRHRSGEVLTALAERLDLETSYDIDGTLRHRAVFSLRNLSHQFLNLELPEGAKLWSVVVDGVGVKPALGADGDHIIPLDLAGDRSRRALSRVELSIEEKGEPGGKAEVRAPALRIRAGDETRPVPVLETRWSLSVPHDQRVIRVDGNLDNLPSYRENILAFALWHKAGHIWHRISFGQLVLALLALGLGYVLLRYALVPMGRWTVGSMNRFLIVSSAAVVLAGIIGLGMTRSGRRFKRALSGAVSKATYAPRAPMAMTEAEESYDEGDGGGAYDDAAPGAASSPKTGDFYRANRELRPELAARAELKENKRLTRGRRRIDAADRLRKADKDMKPQELLRKEMERPAKKVAEKKKREPMKRRPRRPMPKTPPVAQRPAQQPAPPPAPVTRAPRDWGGRQGGKGGGLVPGVDAPAESPSPDPAATPEEPEPEPVMDAEVLLGDESLLEGLRSMVFPLQHHGATQTLNRRGGEARLSFELMPEASYRFAVLASLALLFLGGLVLPKRLGLHPLGWLLLVAGAATALALMFSSSAVTAAANGALAGTALSSAVHLFVGVFAVIGKWRARSRSVRPKVRVIASSLLALLIAAGAAEAQTPKAYQKPQAPKVKKARADEPIDAQVFLPIDDDSHESTGRVYVPRDLFDDLFGRAYPKPAPAPKAFYPAAHALGQVSYSGKISDDELDLTVELSVESFVPWTEVPLGLKGLGVRLDQPGALSIQGPKVVPVSRIRRQAGGLSLILEAPGRYQLKLRAVCARRGPAFSFDAVPAGLGVLSLETADLRNRIRINDGRIPHVESREDEGRSLVAFLGRAGQVSVAVTAPEVMSGGASSDASARNHSLFVLERGAVRVLSDFVLTLTGSGWEGFRFQVPEGLEVVEVTGPGLREWRTLEGDKGRQLEVLFREAKRGQARVTISAEALVKPDASGLVLPEIRALGVSREHGLIGIVTGQGTKIRARPTGSLNQVSVAGSPELQTLQTRAAPRRAIDRAFSYWSRPTSLAVDFVEERTVVKTGLRLVGALSGDEYRWRGAVDFTVSKGALYELTFQVPEGLDCSSVTVKQEGRDALKEWREARVDGERLIVCDLTHGLTGRFQAELELARPVSGASFTVALPDIRPRVLSGQAPSRERGVVVVAVEEGLRVSPKREGAGLLAVSAQSESGWLKLGAKQSARLAYQIRGADRSGELEVERLAPRVRGTFTMHAHVFHDFVRYRVHLAYEVDRSHTRFFSFMLPAELGDRLTVTAPNRRELRTRKVTIDGRQLNEFSLELQSAVLGRYEMTFELDQLIEKSGRIAFPEVALAGVERSRGYVLVEKDSQVDDGLAVVEAREVAAIDVVEVPALPGGRTPYSFIAAHKVQQPRSGTARWSLAYELRKVSMGEGPAAVLDWFDLRSVVFPDGRIQNEARFRLRNRRLQFLELAMPKGAVIWSLSVAGERKRVFDGARAGEIMIPLPKRIEADLSFNVDLTFSTELGAPLTELSRVTPPAPRVSSEGLRPEQSFWTLYLPEDNDYYSFDTNMNQTIEAHSAAQVAERELDEIEALVDLAKREGQQGQIAGGNAVQALSRAAQQLQKAQLANDRVGSNLSSITKTQANAKELYNDNLVKLRELEGRYRSLQTLVTRDQKTKNARSQRGKGVRRTQRAGKDVLIIEKQVYEQSELSGWSLDLKKFQKRQTEWEGLSNKNVQEEQERDQANKLAIMSYGNDKVQQKLAQNQAQGRQLRGFAKQYKQTMANEQRRRSRVVGGLQDERGAHSLGDLTRAPQSGARGPGQSGEKAQSEEYLRRAALGGEAPDSNAQGRGLLTLEVGRLRPTGRAFHFAKIHGGVTVSLKAMPSRVFDGAKQAVQIIAVLLLLVLIPVLGLFSARSEAPTLMRAFAVAGFIGAGWLISLGWIAAALVGFGAVTAMILKRRG